MTSYPRRINGIAATLKTLLNQTFRFDRLVLALASGDFPKREKDLPPELLSLLSDRFSILWTDDDYKSANKLIPALKEYPDDVIITFDDDILYSETIAERLVNMHRDNPGQYTYGLLTQRFNLYPKHKFISHMNDERWESWICHDYPSYFNSQLGVCGVLYPPNSLHKDVFDNALRSRLCPFDDDIWFWIQSIRAGTKMIGNIKSFAYREDNRRRENTISGLYFMHGSTGSTDKAVKDSLRHYPEIYDKLDDERNHVVQKGLFEVLYGHFADGRFDLNEITLAFTCKIISRQEYDLMIREWFEKFGPDR
jgi:hypothetical protein